MTGALHTAVACLAAALFLGCSSRSASSNAADGGAEALTPLEAGGGEPDAEGGPAQTQSFLRVLHASPDAPAVDVCVAPHGTTAFQGPLIAALATTLDPEAGAPDAASDDAAAPVGVVYGQASAYLALTPGALDVQLVAAGASCGTPLAAHAVVPLPTLAAGDFATLLVAGSLSPGDAAPGFVVAPLLDDSALAGGAASLRAVNAFEGAPFLDFGLGSAAAWLPMLVDVPFGSASSRAGTGGGAVDTNGYTPIAPLVGQPLSARLSGDDAGDDAGVADAATAEVTITLGSIVTVVAVGSSTASSGSPARLLVCTDNQPSGGLLSDCTLEP